MDPIRVKTAEARLYPRTSVAQGIVQARLPVPSNWNWFTNVNSVDVVNVSRSGIGIACRVALEDHIEFFFKLASGENFVFSGLVKHQQQTVDGVYHGVELISGHDCLISLFNQCCPSSSHVDLTVISN
ncbi:hypothetical protein K0504_10830 [Neiella marina]|uniref:PilZ domain-containing protein n=1 Tax=Neiella holothuriorum TaxID=2870530 RepID=A0ABS7EGR0_9GAMM|nr:hypothetical protein [Neiella holothuriorum]MBW8191532.1 hypothetical protein [Neiella holothuriorum]